MLHQGVGAGRPVSQRQGGAEREREERKREKERGEREGAGGRLGERESKPSPPVPSPPRTTPSPFQFPQGRTQPYIFYVSPDGRVSYRVEVNAEYVSPLELRAYPLDSQDLRIVLVYTNFNPTVSNVSFVASASGSKIFTFGTGDDLSGYRVADVFVKTRGGLWSDQFSRAVLAPSARGDPLPVYPAPRAVDVLAAAAVAEGNASATLKPAKMFGKDYTITEAQVIIRLQRLVAASGLQILPIVLCTTVAFITMFVSGEADGKGGREGGRRGRPSHPFPSRLTSLPSFFLSPSLLQPKTSTPACKSWSPCS